MMKRLISLLNFLLFFAIRLFAFTEEDIKNYTLENGLKIFFLKDTTTATIRTELNILAGLSQQEKDSVGFIQLYARLAELELTPDCVKTEDITSPNQLENTLIKYTNFFKELSVSDTKLNKEVSSLKKYASDFTTSITGFINAAIDSRIFSESPWKQESGINPLSISTKSTSEIRSILNSITKKYYTPQNALLYVSGNITEKELLTLVQKYFGNIKNTSEKQNNSNIITNTNANEQKIQKFVLTHDDLSTDLTQIVIQYKDFSSIETELLSKIFNNNKSEYKRLLLKQRNLAIRDAEYINISAANNRNSNRLIIQSILEKTKVSPVIQGDLFLQMATETNRITSQELELIKKIYESNYLATFDNSQELIKLYANFNIKNQNANSSLQKQIDEIKNLTVESLNSVYNAKTPYVFLLVNTKNYIKYEKEFKKSGYIRLTEKNSFWFKQENQKNKKHPSQTTTKTHSSTNKYSEAADRFITENKNQFSSFYLTNSIPVVIKEVKNSTTVAINLSIDGGDLLFATKNIGLTSVLTNSLALNIQKQLDIKASQGILKRNTNVTAQTFASSSLITITCNTNELYDCLNAAAEAIIFGDITPAMADGIMYDLRTQWRIQTGAPDFQLLCEAVRTIYSKPYTNLFENNKDKPNKMDYTDIIAAYPIILDSSRFSISLVGGIDNNKELKNVLNKNFGELNSIKETESIKSTVPQNKIKDKTKRIQIKHQFFTDISADKAGPRPAVLIPTTDFSDPLLYIIGTPEISSTDCALFNALLYRLEEKLQEKVSSEQKVIVKAPTSDLPFAQIIVTKIKHINQTDSLYKNVISDLIEELKLIIDNKLEFVKDLEKNYILNELENKWVLKELTKTNNLIGTSELIHNGIIHNNPTLYIDMYKAITNATAEDYYIIAKSFFEDAQTLRLYSADSKK